MTRTCATADDDSRLVIHPLDPGDPEAGRLLALSDAFLQSLYPSESNHLESATALKKDNVIFLGAVADGEVVGCGAVKPMDDDGIYGEIKRVFVVEGQRGRRIAERIMKVLEQRMTDNGITVFRLETGIHQTAALQLYRRLGYCARPPFGAYRPDPLSVFLEKRHAGDAAVNIFER